MTRDDITKIFNRKALRDAFQDILDGTSGDSEYIFVMLDLDDFKMLNDQHGHMRGDMFLIEVGKILQKNCPSDGMPFRFGGDEFCLLIKNRGLEDVKKICKDIQRDIIECKTNKKREVPFTISVGIAKYERGLSPKQLLRNTDSKHR